MLFWAVLGVNCVYLLAELIFNAQLINIASANSTPNQIENIEIFGRTLSTIGFSLLFIKLIHMSPFAKNIKIFLWVVVLLLAHPIFFIGQKEVINHIADSTSYSQKESYYNTFLVKKAMLGEQEHEQKMIFFDDPNSISSKVFFSSMGITKNDSSIISLYEKNDKIIELAAIGDAKYMADRIFNAYVDFGNDNQNLYEDYKKVQNQYQSNIDLVKGEALENYRRFTSDKGRNIVFNHYERMSKNIKDAYKFATEKMPSETKSAAWYVGKCTTMECLNEKINGYRETQRNLAKVYLKSKADTLPTFDFYNFCSFSGTNKPNSTTYMTIIENGKKDFQRSRNLLINTGMSKPNMKCTVNLDNLSNIYGNHFKDMVRKNMAIENFNMEDVDTFSNSNEFRNIVVEMARREGFELNLPKNWHYSDKETFLKVATQDIQNNIKSKFDKAMKERIGVAIPLNLSQKEFMNGPYLQNMINDEFKKEYDITVSEKSSTEFFENNKDKLIKISGLELLDINLETQGGQIVKAMIIPSIAMFLSLLFFLLNGILFGRDILVKIIDKKKSNIIAIVATLIVFIVPLFIPNFDEGHALFISDLKENNFWLAIAYDWTLSWETIVYPLGNLINESLLPFIEKYLDMETLKSIDF